MTPVQALSKIEKILAELTPEMRAWVLEYLRKTTPIS